VSVTIDASVWLAAISPTETAHAASLAVLRALARTGVTLHQPTLFVVEVCAAVARRTRDSRLALQAASVVRSEPRIVTHEIDDVISADATQIAAHCALRGADSIYVSTARVTGSTLITLDNELLDRAGHHVRVTDPATWLTEHQPDMLG
jgi:predicted nucleic acid-binding protein